MRYLNASASSSLILLLRFSLTPLFFAGGFLAGCLKPQQPQQVVDNCFPSDAVIDGTLSGDFFVGFTHKQDPATHKNPSSPTIHFKGDVSSGTNALKPEQDTTGGIEVYNKSVFLMEGGNISGYLTAKDHSRVTMTGGEITGQLGAEDASIVTVRGGTVAFNMVITQKATVTIEGGEVSSPAIYDSSVVNLVGGKTNGTLTVGDTATVHLRGGVPPEYLSVYGSATLNVYGTNLKKTLVDAHDQNGDHSRYKLSGKLSDGTDLGNVSLEIKNERKLGDEKTTVHLISLQK
ncbi:MAG: hypothetical protein V4671_28960 [Armatimonadota bacterium]